MSRELIQSEVNNILRAHPNGIDFFDLQMLLMVQGIDVQPYAPGGLLKGVSYSCAGYKWPGSKIGREFSAGLADRGVTFSLENAHIGGQSLLGGLGQGAALVHAQRKNEEVGTKGLASKMVYSGTVITQPTANQLSPLGVRPHRLKASGGGFVDVSKFSREVEQLDIGPLSKAMLVLGAAAVNLGAEALRALLRFVEKLLGFFGIALRQRVEPTAAQNGPTLGYEPYLLYVDKNDDSLLTKKSKIEAAAGKILETAKAISTDTPELCPRDPEEAQEARRELVAALRSSKAVGVAATRNELCNVSASRSGLTEAARAVAQPSQLSAQATPDFLVQIRMISERYIAALAESRRVTAKVPISTRRLDVAEIALAKASSDFELATTQLHIWKKANPFKALIGAGGAERSMLESAAHKAGLTITHRRAHVSRLQKSLAEEKQKWEATPAPAVPHSLLLSIKNLRAELANAAIFMKTAFSDEIAGMATPDLKKAANEAVSFVVAQLKAMEQEIYVRLVGDLELKKALERLSSVRALARNAAENCNSALGMATSTEEGYSDVYPADVAQQSAPAA